MEKMARWPYPTLRNFIENQWRIKAIWHAAQSIWCAINPFDNFVRVNEDNFVRVNEDNVARVDEDDVVRVNEDNVVRVNEANFVRLQYASDL